jgi:hypothetical protein
MANFVFKINSHKFVTSPKRKSSHNPYRDEDDNDNEKKENSDG